MIEQIKELCLKANPNYEFHYQSLLDENYQTQMQNIGNKFVFLEEQKDGYFTNGYILKRTSNIILYVCTMIDALQTDTATLREEIRKQMQTEFIIPFIKEFSISPLNQNSQNYSIPFELPLPMFDNYAIVEILSLQVTENIC